MTHWPAGIAVAFLLAGSCGCGLLLPPYSAEPIEAWVVDAETKQPLKGVVVVAYWELQGIGYSPGGSSPIGPLMVMESVTDKSGRFYFPVWGPIRQFKGELHEHDPELFLFKPGYDIEILGNDYGADPPALTRVHRSQWNGKTIPLLVFTGTDKQYAERLSYFSGDLHNIYEEDCNWKKMPRMILALDADSRRFRKAGIPWGPQIEYMSADESKCGTTLQKFFESYQP